MGLILKTSSATCLLGFAGCGIMCASGCTNTIKQQLIDDGFTLINSEENWNSIFKDLKDDSLKDKVDLKKSCQTLLKQSPDKENWRRAVKWCVEEKTVKDVLSKNYIILGQKPEAEEEKTIWERKAQKLKRSKNTEFEKWKNTMKNNNPDAETLKAECQKLKPSAIKTTEESFEDIFIKTKEFCSVKKNGSN